MDEKFTRIEYKMDRLVEVQNEILVNLSEHMRRTELAEESIEKLAEAIKPVQEHVAVVRGMGRVTAWLVGIAAGIATVVMLFIKN